MWFDLSKKVNWLVALMGCCFLSIFFVTLIANYFNIKIYHDSPWGIIKTFTVLFFLPGYVGYKSMFILGYVKEQSTLNIYAENFWGFSPITIFLPAMMGGFFANNIYKEIENKSNKQTYHEQLQYNYAPPPQSNSIQNVNIDETQSSSIPVATSATQQKEEADQKKAKAILMAHPDVLEIGSSQEFRDWINNQPHKLKREYENLYKNGGTSTQIISMLDKYKSYLANKQIKADHALQVELTKQIEIDTQNQNQSIASQNQNAEQAHFNAIFTAHPDAGAIVESQEFQYWINSQTKGWRDYYNNILINGTSDQVIRMINDYKKGINH